MAVHDLTPQLRTRLSKVERAVGWFVILATILLLSGFGYYVYHMAQRKGWTLIKVRYHTFLDSAAGIGVGDKVRLMGFNVGEVTRIEAMPPGSDWGNVYIEFVVWEPYYGYVWNDSKVRVGTGDFLGKRSLELIEGGTSGATNLTASYKIENGQIKGVFDDKKGEYVPYTKQSQGYTLLAEESPALAGRMEALALQVENALPNILNLTNQISAVLSNTTRLTARAADVVDEAGPLLTNLTLITDNLRNPNGSLGEWLIPTNMNSQLTLLLTNVNGAVGNANNTLTNVNTNLVTVVSNLNLSLENLANITSNLNQQVQFNTNILGNISKLIVDADHMVQGLKGHWFLRGAFKEKKTNDTRPSEPRRSREPLMPRSRK